MFIVELVPAKYSAQQSVTNAVIDAMRGSSILLTAWELRLCTTNGIVIASNDCSIQKHEKWW